MSDIHAIKEIAKTAALAAGEILSGYFGKIKKVGEKKDSSLITEADNAAEEKIISIIKSKFADHSILAEESGLNEKTSHYKWVIDPLDGTTNFAHQIPFFCTSIALEKDNEIVLACVYEPIHKKLYQAEKNAGAFCNGERISVSPTKRVSSSLFATGFAYQRGKFVNEQLRFMAPFIQKSHGIRRTGSAVWDLCQVAAGHLDGFFEKNLKPWDVAAGELLVREAGGTLSLYNGSKATIYDQEIVASNGIIHNEVVQMLKD